METQEVSNTPGPRPTADEAEAALRSVEEARSSIGEIPVPPWCTPTLAALLGMATVGQLLPAFGPAVVGALAAAGMGVIAGRFIDKSGARARIRTRALWPVLPLALVYGAAAVLNDYGHWWAWAVAAASGVVTVLGVGHHHRRRRQGPA